MGVRVCQRWREIQKKDFTKAFQELEELGTKGLTPVSWALNNWIMPHA